MLSRTIIKKQRGRRTLTALAVLSLLTGTFVVSGTALADLDRSLFELDKNAQNDITTLKLGELGAQISNATTTSIKVCETGTEPGTPFSILIDAERLRVTAVAAGYSGGGCSATKKTFTVVRGDDGTTAASHAGGENVTLLNVDANGDPSGTVSGDDWDQVYAEVLADPETKCAALTGAVECTWVHDGRAESIFTSSKDYDEIVDWQWRDQSVPDADELDDGFAIKYSNGDQQLFFGSDRFATNGSKDAGFWFFHDAVGTVDPVGNADGTFIGAHTEPDPGDNGIFCGQAGNTSDPTCSPYDADDSGGDILVLTTFTNGGAVTSIRVFEWIGPAGSDAALFQRGAAGDCVPGSSTQDLCATVNDTTVESPWPYSGKGEPQADAINAGGLMEGGINLSDFGLEGCFSSFMATTRSAPSLTADPKDFILGNFEACGSELLTTPSDSAASPLTDGDDDDTLPEAQLGTGSAGVDVTDSALLTVSGTTNFSGTVSYFICGPIASGTCDTGGVAAGSDDVTGNGTTTSDTANLTEVGRYCWRGEFDSDTEGVPDASDASEGECFEVLPVQPTISTSATAMTELGNAITDVATLSGTAYQPGIDGDDTTYPSINATMDTAANGSITFKVYGPGDETCATAVSTSDPFTVAGDSPPDYGPASFTPTEPGTYRWIASYTGDEPNTLSVSGLCNDPNETSVLPDAYIALTPLTATNEVNDPHTITATVQQDTGSGWENAPDDTLVTFTLLNNTADATFVGDVNTCTTTDGQCTVQINTTTAGSVDIHATTTFTVAGVELTRETDGTGNNSVDANKVYVDAYITIGPDGTNTVGDPHTFTVSVFQDDGLATGGDGVDGFGPAPDGTTVTVTLTDSDGATNSVISDDCASPGTSGGTCDVTFTSPTAGTVTGHAEVTFSVGGVSVTRETDDVGLNSADAVKVFVAGSIAWSKVDNAGALQGGATFEVCQTHGYDIGLADFVDITDVCVSIEDNVAPDTDLDDGEFLYSGLSLGRYTVTETEAPDGFEPDPDTETVELTPGEGNTDKTIGEAFVNSRSIIKITGFGYTNDATGTPTHGITSGTVTYTVTLHNYGGAAGTLTNSSLVVSSNADCDPSNAKALTGSVGAGADSATFTLTCTYTDLADGDEVTATLTVKYTTNGLERQASGSPATITYTIQDD